MARRRNSKHNKVDGHQAVTDRIVAALEKGVTPWACPWDRSLGLPRNGKSGRPYSGMNILLTWAADFGDPRWYTFDNAMELNGWEIEHEEVKRYGKTRKVKRWVWADDKTDAPCKPWECGIRKGEQSTKIVHYKLVTKTEKDKTTGEETSRSWPQLKVWSVFNHEQIAWVGGHEPKLSANPIDPETANEAAANLFGALPATVKHGGSSACYIPSQDEIHLPAPEAFLTADSYWSTRAHKTVHWTGAKLRCDRKIRNRFGTDAYAFEELVAELGAAFLATDLGLTAKLQHSEYLGHWLKVLKGDKHAIFRAAKQANEALAWVKGDDKCQAAAA